MSVKVLRIRFPGLLVAVSVEQPHRRRLNREYPSESASAWAEHDCVARRFPSIAEIEPNLMKLQA